VPKLPPKKVLIVDDNRDSADSLAMLLRIEGHDVHVAGDGAEALAQAERLLPQVVVLDIGLPKMDGYEVARRLRRLHWPHGLRLIAVTGYGQHDDLRASTEAGFERHLVKPIDPAELARIIG
jgi:CheY-like chemotaxis protein